MKDKEEKKNKANEELAALQTQCAEYLNGWKRCQADYQNLVKETAKNQADFVRFANQNLILELLPLLDNFKMAQGQIPEKERASAWGQGFSHILKQFQDFLKQQGVMEIETVGQKFNLIEHEAVETVSDPAQEDDIIVAEKRPGYKLNNKVVQVAKVIVNMRDGSDKGNRGDKGDPASVDTTAGQASATSPMN